MRLIDASKLQTTTTYFGISDTPVEVVKKSAIDNAKTVEAVPLSVIEKIKDEIDNDRLCYAEELQKPLKKKHTLYELKEYTARQELLSMKCAIYQDVLDIIDKAVKECEA